MAEQTYDWSGGPIGPGFLIMIAPLVAVVSPPAVPDFVPGGGGFGTGQTRHSLLLKRDDEELMELIPMFLEVIKRANSC